MLAICRMTLCKSLKMLLLACLTQKKKKKSLDFCLQYHDFLEVVFCSLLFTASELWSKQLGELAMVNLEYGTVCVDLIKESLRPHPCSLTEAFLTHTQSWLLIVTCASHEDSGLLQGSSL